MNCKKVNLAIVGCGAITSKTHLPASIRSEIINVFALIDSKIENAKDLANRFSVDCIVADDLQRVIDDIDGVLIATPNYTHASIAKIALNRGVPTFIEKPIVTNYEDAVELCQIAKINKTFISVGYTTRQYPSVLLMKKLIESNFLGEIINFHYEYGSKGGWEPLSGYNVERKMVGGGVLMITGTHFIDRMLYWFGEPVEIHYRDDSYGGPESNCKANMVFGSPTGSFTGSFFMSKTVRLRQKMYLNTQKYLCELGETQTESITLYPKDNNDVKIEVFPTEDPQDQICDYSLRQIEEFANNIVRKGHITVDGVFAAKSIKLIQNMYEHREQLEEPWLCYGNKRRERNE